MAVYPQGLRFREHLQGATQIHRFCQPADRGSEGLAFRLAADAPQELFQEACLHHLQRPARRGVRAARQRGCPGRPAGNDARAPELLMGPLSRRAAGRGAALLRPLYDADLAANERTSELRAPCSAW